MLRTPRKLVHDLHTENDGKSYDPVRVAGTTLLVPAIPTFIWGTVYTTLQNHHFDYGGFGMGVAGLASVILSLAAGISIKARTDGLPPQPPPPPPSGDGPCSQAGNG